MIVVVLALASSHEASLRFYRDGLGLKTSDYIDMDLGDGAELTATFLHAGPRPHSLAVLPDRLTPATFTT